MTIILDTVLHSWDIVFFVKFGTKLKWDICVFIIVRTKLSMYISRLQKLKCFKIVPFLFKCLFNHVQYNAYYCVVKW